MPQKKTGLYFYSPSLMPGLVGVNFKEKAVNIAQTEPSITRILRLKKQSIFNGSHTVK
jgi:hypothetical protein